MLAGFDARQRREIARRGRLLQYVTIACSCHYWRVPDFLRALGRSNVARAQKLREGIGGTWAGLALQRTERRQAVQPWREPIGHDHVRPFGRCHPDAREAPERTRKTARSCGA